MLPLIWRAGFKTLDSRLCAFTLLLSYYCDIVNHSFPALSSHTHFNSSLHPDMMDEDAIIKELCGDISHPKPPLRRALLQPGYEAHISDFPLRSRCQRLAAALQANSTKSRGTPACVYQCVCTRSVPFYSLIQ